VIKIRSLDIDTNTIPDFNQFLVIFNQMKEYWNSKSDQYKVFFENASKAISNKKIKTFVFEDFKTAGLDGDDENGTFNACVNSENVNKKDNQNALGKFGIGKNAVFGLSAIQTVFYSSLNQKNEYKFKGLSKLGTYIDNEGVKRAERIQYGVPSSDNEVLLVSNNNEIPEVFRRTESGLSQFILGVELVSEWQIQIKKAFISNYWFLFENKKLVVMIGDDKLSQDNYYEEALTLFQNDTSKENPIPYIRAFKECKDIKRKQISKIGNVSLFLIESIEDEFLPNKILFLRDGMKIKSDPLGVGGLPTKIAGVIFCEDEIGNRILGGMEPHTHDNFYPEFVEVGMGLSIEEARKILKEIDEFKKECILKIKEKYTTGTDIVSEVDELFNTILGNHTKGEKKISSEETFKRSISKIDIECSFDTNSKAILIDKNKLESIDTGEGEGPGIGKGKGGKGIHGNGKKSIGQKGGAAVSDKKVSTPSKEGLKARFFKLQEESDEQFNTYTMILRSNISDENFDIEITQHGDSNRSQGQMSSKLISIFDNTGNIVQFTNVENKEKVLTGYILKNLKITSNIAAVYKLKFEEKMNSALKIK
jgi:hypothetical protein